MNKISFWSLGFSYIDKVIAHNFYFFIVSYTKYIRQNQGAEVQGFIGEKWFDNFSEFLSVTGASTI